MKTRLCALLVVLLATMLFAVSCGNGSQGDPGVQPPDGDYIYAEGSELYLVHDGSDAATKSINDLTSLISDRSGVMPKVRGAVMDDVEHSLLLGSTEHPLSAAALDILADADLDGFDNGYVIYSDGASVAIVWSCDYAAALAIEYFTENLCTGPTLTMQKGYAFVKPVDTSIHEAEILEAGFKVLEEELSAEAVAAIRKLYTLYTDDFYIWLANLWDPEVGAFYYSNSARDNEPFLPDIESTGQGLTILTTAGMFRESGSWASTLPKDAVDAIGEFAYNMQAEDGFFYHVQWGTNINVSRRGRDLNRAASILSDIGIKPKYKLATDQIAEDELVSCLVSPLGRSAAVAVSRIVATADVDYLSSEEKFLAYLDSLDFANASYASGHQLSSTNKQIKAAGLAEVCIKYLDERQNPENGFWESTVTYSSMNGFLKISSTYNGLGGKINYLDRAIDSIFEILLGDEMPTTLPQLYNLTNGIGNALNNLKKQGDTELYNSTQLRIRENAAAIAETLYLKIATFRKDDGSFSYYVDHCSPTSQGCTVALKLNEGDVNAGSMAFHATSGFFKILGIAMPRMYTEYDAELFCELIENASPITKIELPPPEHTTYEDGILPSNTVPGLKAGALSFIQDPREGGDYVMELVSAPGNSDSVRVNVQGTTSKLPSCFVYEADLCIARNAADGTMVQINTNNYMLNLRIAGDEVTVLDCSLTSGEDRFTNDTGIRLKVGEWFTLRIEYYIGDADSVRIVTTVNGDQKYVSNNYYGRQPTLVDQPGEPIPGINNKGIMFFCMKASDISLLIDNVLVDSTADVYVPGDGEADLEEKPAETGPLFTFDTSDTPPASVYTALQAGTLSVEKDSRDGVEGNVLKFVSAADKFENIYLLYSGAKSEKGYRVSAEVCYTDLNAVGVAARINLDDIFSLDFRHDGDGKISVRKSGTSDVIYVLADGQWFDISATVTPLGDGSVTVSVSIGENEILTATVTPSAGEKISTFKFTTLKASTHTTLIDDVLVDAVS